MPCYTFFLFLGRTTYFKPEHKDDPIYYRDHAQWLNIKEKNSSITEQTTFSDIYYASVYDVSNVILLCLITGVVSHFRLEVI